MADAKLDVVFLLPGFLGFDRLRDYAYFAERFATALRASLMARTARPLEVIPVPLPPTRSLADRQLALGKTLFQRSQDLMEARGASVRAIHLVGHSTGGVDAHLFTLERALADRSWRDFDGVDVRWVKERIRSVISLGSPHQGTCLADDPVAKLFATDSPGELLERPLETIKVLVQVAGELLGAVPGLLRDPELKTLLNGIQSREGLAFLGDILHSRALIEDLSPALMIDRYGVLGPAQGNVHRRSFVTMAGVTPDAGKNAVQSADASPVKRSPSSGLENYEPPGDLFMLLAQLTSGRSTKCFAEGQLHGNAIAAIERVRADEARVIAADRKLVPDHIDQAQNDGIVNSVRQLIDPNDQHECVALIIADHFDVVGHYDRQFIVTNPKTGAPELKDQISGLLHSGSQFRDSEFFELIRRMAESMLPAFV